MHHGGIIPLRGQPIQTGRYQGILSIATTVSPILCISRKLYASKAPHRKTHSILDGRLRRIPYGETGERINWFGWQARFIGSNAQFDMLPPNPNDQQS